MKIYKLIIHAYDYWYDMDRDGFVKVEKFFTTKDKAEVWKSNHPKFIYNGFNAEHTEAKKDYEMPKFEEIQEIEVE